MYCTNCGEGIQNNAYACIHCGFATNTENNFCSNCGVATNEKQVICTKCGMLLPKGKVPSDGKKHHSDVWGRKTTAGVLAIFLGGIGVHKFYHGSWGWGIIYLLFFLTFIPAIIGFIEGIVYLSMDENKYRVKYLSGDKNAFKW